MLTLLKRLERLNAAIQRERNVSRLVRLGRLFDRVLKRYRDEF